MPGNWKLDGIIKALGDAGRALPARDIAPSLSMTSKQVSNYIRNNLLYKYVEAKKIPLIGRSPAPWLNLYNLTEEGITRYRRLIQ